MALWGEIGERSPGNQVNSEETSKGAAAVMQQEKMETEFKKTNDIKYVMKVEVKPDQNLPKGPLKKKK